jgi:thiol-disulfide isomerase/thioredoxin
MKGGKQKTRKGTRSQKKQNAHKGTRSQEKQIVRKTVNADPIVIEQTEPIITEETKKTPIIIGLVYSNGCGHCDAMKPAWNEMKAEVESDPSLKDVVDILEIERSDPQMDSKIKDINSDLVNCQPLMVQGFPTMFCKKEHYLEPYEGGREKAELMEWVQKSVAKQMGGKKRHGHKNQTHKKRSMLSYLKFW